MSESLVPSNRICPECGSDIWWSRNRDRTIEENQRLRSWVERDAMQHAREVAILRLRLMDAEEAVRLAQRKRTRQARVIRRLEDRLRARGQRPYEGVVRPDATPEGHPMPDDNMRLRAWVDGLYGHGQISKELYDRIRGTGWPAEQGDTP